MGLQLNATHIAILVVLAVIFMLSRRPSFNAEEWEWTDHRGKTRRISVHREVH